MSNDEPMRFDKLAMFRLIADKIERDPVLLQIGLDNIERWIAKGSDQQHRLRQWEEMIRAAQATRPGMALLISALREDSEPAAQFREFAPFAGVLSNNELVEFLHPCAFAH